MIPAENKDDVEDDLKWVSFRETSENSIVDKSLSKFSKNPFVPLGAFVTLGILGNGLYNFVKGNHIKQQMMMRYRCLAQGVTLVVACVGMFFGGGKAVK